MVVRGVHRRQLVKLLMILSVALRVDLIFEVVQNQLVFPILINILGLQELLLVDLKVLV